MPFEHGTISCRIFQVPRTLPKDAIERFAGDVAPPVDSSAHVEIRGWVSGRHLLDRVINEDTAYYGGFLRLTLLSAQRKIPTSLLRAECRMEELAHMATHRIDFVDRKQRAEIRRTVEERLLPQMPPQLNGIPFVYIESSGVIYASATSIRQMDSFMAFFTHTLGMQLTPCMPGALAQERRSVKVEDWRPSSWSPDLTDGSVEASAGREFLTWLWFTGEARGGILRVGDLGEVGILIEGPLTLFLEGNGAHETVLRRGDPLCSAEAKASLLAGKTLRTAKLTLTLGEDIFVTTLDAEEFVLRSLRLPDIDALDAVSRFQERMFKLDTFREALFSLYDRFIEERRDSSIWKKTKKEIHQWVSTRKTRH